MLLGATAPTHHNLWALYKRLPNRELMDSIKAGFDKTNQTQGETVAALEVALSVGPMNEDDLKRASEEATRKNQDSSLKGVLTRSSDAFFTWRYLHEQASTGKVRLIRYEFARMALIANVLRSHVIQGIGEAQKVTAGRN